MRHYLKAIDSLVPALLATLVLVGCGDMDKPQEVSLAMLTENATDFDNNQVVTRGMVRRFEAPLPIAGLDNRVRISVVETVGSTTPYDVPQLESRPPPL